MSNVDYETIHELDKLDDDYRHKKVKLLQQLVSNETIDYIQDKDLRDKHKLVDFYLSDVRHILKYSNKESSFEKPISDECYRQLSTVVLKMRSYCLDWYPFETEEEWFEDNERLQNNEKLQDLGRELVMNQLVK